MLHLTKQEKYVLAILGSVIFFGSILNYLTKTYPQLHNILESVENNRFVYKININTASQEELIGVPYIGAFTAEKIIKYRQEQGEFKSLEEIKLLKGIHKKSFDIFVILKCFVGKE